MEVPVEVLSVAVFLESVLEVVVLLPVFLRLLFVLDGLSVFGLMLTEPKSDRRLVLYTLSFLVL